MNALISRQAAIDLLEELETKRLQGDVGLLYAPMIKGLKALPSAEPEQVRCKDCLMHGVCTFERGLGLNGYCSQAERRTDG